jgi:hypothetical protein
MEHTQETAPRGDYSFAELRSMMTGETPAETTPAADEKTATPAKEADASDETAPESGSDDSNTQEGKQQERGPDGKFKAAEKTEDGTHEDDPPGVKKRIGKALRERREAQERAEAAERRLAELQQGRPPAKEEAAAKPAAADKPKPKLEDFNTYEEFNEALVEWKVDQRESAREAKRQQDARQAAQATVLQAHQKRVEAAREKHADFDARLEALKMPISQELHNAIVESELGPEVAYYCATNPEEAKRIAALSPIRQVAEFGKLEALLTAEAKPAKPAEKKPLPKPAAAVGGGASGASAGIDLNDPKLPMDSFKREVAKRLKKA